METNHAAAVAASHSESGYTTARSGRCRNRRDEAEAVAQEWVGQQQKQKQQQTGHSVRRGSLPIIGVDQGERRTRTTHETCASEDEAW